MLSHALTNNVIDTIWWGPSVGTMYSLHVEGASLVPNYLGKIAKNLDEVPAFLACVLNYSVTFAWVGTTSGACNYHHCVEMDDEEHLVLEEAPIRFSALPSKVFEVDLLI